jgi:hypothetical protein
VNSSLDSSRDTMHESPTSTNVMFDTGYGPGDRSERWMSGGDEWLRCREVGVDANAVVAKPYDR